MSCSERGMYPGIEDHYVQEEMLKDLMDDNVSDSEFFNVWEKEDDSPMTFAEFNKGPLLHFIPAMLTGIKIIDFGFGLAWKAVNTSSI